MNNKEFSKNLEGRTKKFAVTIIRLSASLINSTETRVVRNQITKSATSVDANYREVNRSRSKADFMNKIRICESEASETQYWLEVIVEAGWMDRSQLKKEYDECSFLRFSHQSEKGDEFNF
jgi:four helix bundle protein